MLSLPSHLPRHSRPHLRRLLLPLPLLLLSALPAAAERVITVGAYENQPILFRDDDGEIKGFFADLLHHVAQLEGWRVEWRFGQWSDVYGRLERGEIDLLAAIARSEAREKHFDYPHTDVFTNWGQLFVPRNSPITSILELEGKRIAAFGKDIHYLNFKETARNFGIDVEFVEVTSNPEVLRMVSDNRVDGGVISRLYGLLHEHEYNVTRSTVIFNPINVSFATTTGSNADLLNAIGDTLKRLKADRDSLYYRSHARWLEGEGAQRTYLWLIRGLGAAVTLILLFGLLNLWLNRQVALKTRSLREEVSERKKAQASLQRSQAIIQRHNQELEERVARRTVALKRANDAKDRFFSIIAHDLRGPVGNLAVIFSQANDGEIDFDRSLLGGIAASTRNLHQQLEDLLTWARSQKGEIEHRPEHFPIEALVTSALELHRQSAEQKRINLRWEADPTIIHADRAMVTTVLRNLINNAIKFTPEGGTVTLSAQRREGALELSVRDTGVGIAPDRLDKMFKLGEENSSSVGTRREKGSGLGLVLCREFVEANGGTIGVESRCGHGSRFFFTLPLGDAAHCLDHPTDQRLRERVAGLSVLVVDDDIINAKTTLMVLTQLEAHVELTHDAGEALDALTQGNHQLVLMDVDMPGMDGIQLTAEIHQRITTPPPVIALTSHQRSELSHRLGEVRFDAFLHKPLDPEALLHALSALLGGTKPAPPGEI